MLYLLFAAQYHNNIVSSAYNFCSIYFFSFSPSISAWPMKRIGQFNLTKKKKKIFNNLTKALEWMDAAGKRNRKTQSEREIEMDGRRTLKCFFVFNFWVTEAKQIFAHLLKWTPRNRYVRKSLCKLKINTANESWPITIWYTSPNEQHSFSECNVCARERARVRP